MSKAKGTPVRDIGHCIYDPSHSEPFSEEHILAANLGGEFTLPNASCAACAYTINKEIEQPVMRRMMRDIRYRREIGSRRLEKRSSELSVLKPRNTEGVASDMWEWEKVNVPREEHPSPLVLPVLRQPGFLKKGGSPPTEPWLQGMWWHMEPSSLEGPDKDPVQVQTEHNTEVFCRLIAKTAHCVAVAQFGPDSFTPYLPDIILGRDLSQMSHLIGGKGEPEPPASSHYEIFFAQTRDPNFSKHIICSIRLFADLAAPTYLAVVGERR